MWKYVLVGWLSGSVGFMLGAYLAIGVKFNKKISRPPQKQRGIYNVCAMCAGELEGNEESLCNPCLNQALAEPLNYP